MILSRFSFLFFLNLWFCSPPTDMTERDNVSHGGITTTFTHDKKRSVKQVFIPTTATKQLQSILCTLSEKTKLHTLFFTPQTSTSNKCGKYWRHETERIVECWMPFKSSIRVKFQYLLSISIYPPTEFQDLSIIKIDYVHGLGFFLNRWKIGIFQFFLIDYVVWRIYSHADKIVHFPSCKKRNHRNRTVFIYRMWMNKLSMLTNNLLHEINKVL